MRMHLLVERAIDSTEDFEEVKKDITDKLNEHARDGWDLMSTFVVPRRDDNPMAVFVFGREEFV